MKKSGIDALILSKVQTQARIWELPDQGIHGRKPFAVMGEDLDGIAVIGLPCTRSMPLEKIQGGDAAGIFAAFDEIDGALMGSCRW